MMSKKKIARRSGRGITCKAQPDSVTLTAVKQGKRRLIKCASHTHQAEDEPLKCASPPCYLSEIEY
jgi:hypothetical protein